METQNQTINKEALTAFVAELEELGDSIVQFQWLRDHAASIGLKLTETPGKSGRIEVRLNGPGGCGQMTISPPYIPQENKYARENGVWFYQGAPLYRAPNPGEPVIGVNEAAVLICRAVSGQSPPPSPFMGRGRSARWVCAQVVRLLLPERYCPVHGQYAPGAGCCCPRMGERQEVRKG